MSRKATASPRYVPRDDSSRSKYGSVERGTHAAHKMSWELYNGIGAHMPGRPASSHHAIAAAMSADSNLHIKSAHGNTVLDRRRDARIVAAFASGEHTLHERTTAERASIAYRSGMSADAHPTMRARAEAIGEMSYHDGTPGRPIKVKNLHKH